MIGLALQIRKIWQRRISGYPRGEITAVISAEYFFASFLAIFSTLLYGGALERFNHYLVWPRTGAVVMILYILLELTIDRRTKKVACLTALPWMLAISGFSILIFNRGFAISNQELFKSGVVAMALILFVGNLSQVRELRSGQGTGAVSLALHSMYFLKDVSLTVFGIVLGAKQGWPIIIAGGLDASLKAVILYYYFKAREIDQPKGQNETGFEPEAKVVGA